MFRDSDILRHQIQIRQYPKIELLKECMNLLSVLVFKGTVYIDYKIENIRLLTTANTKHLGSAATTHTLGRWFTVFHSDSLGIFHFFLRAALYTICFHLFPSHFSVVIRYLKHGDIFIITGGTIKNHCFKNYFEQLESSIFILGCFWPMSRDKCTPHNL
jgi:hypothetical protein